MKKQASLNDQHWFSRPTIVGLTRNEPPFHINNFCLLECAFQKSKKVKLNNTEFDGKGYENIF